MFEANVAKVQKSWEKATTIQWIQKQAGNWGEQIDPKINSIDTNTSIGIGSILAQLGRYLLLSFKFSM